MFYNSLEKSSGLFFCEKGIDNIPLFMSIIIYRGGDLLMAKRKKAAKKSVATKSRKSAYRVETYGIKYNSLTFLLFLVFVLVVAMLLVSTLFGMNLY